MKDIFLIIFFIFNIVSINSKEFDALEIPVKSIRVKGMPKYSDIAFEDPEFDDNQDDDIILRSSEGQAFFNANGLYLASLRLGSNQQPFNLLLDTGSPLIWVSVVGSSDAYPLIHHYDPRISTTSKNTLVPFNIKYGSGNCAGYYYIDRFTYPGNSQFSCRFGAASITNFNVYQGDGIIGLSRNYNEINLSFIYSIKNAQISNSLAFSLKFNVKNNQIVGKMILGKDSDFSQPNLATCPLVTLSVNPIFWACTLSTFGFKSSKASQTYNVGKGVIFDTGTNNILLPTECFQQLKTRIKKFNCDYQQAQGSYRLICQLNDYIPDFTLNFNGHEFTILRSIFYVLYNNNILIPSLIFTDNVPAPIIGSPFFIAIHTLFDHNSNVMTFAPSFGTIK